MFCTEKLNVNCFEDFSLTTVLSFPGPVPMGGDAPYMSNHGDHLMSQRSSPDSVLSLASDAYGPPRSSSAGFGPHPMSETPVW